MSTASALVLEILEAALSCDDERALRLAEEAGCTRFELARLRHNLRDPETGIEDAKEEGYEEGYEAGLDEAIEMMRDFIDARPPKLRRKAS